MREKKLNIDGERGRKMRGQRKRERERECLIAHRTEV